MEETHPPATQQTMLRSGPETSERGSVMMAAAAADTRVDCQQQAGRYMKSSRDDMKKTLDHESHFSNIPPTIPS